jgi:hypothetical protein
VIGRYVVRFADNRITPEAEETLMAEEDLLIEDCIQRIPTVAKMGSARDLEDYLARLSRLVGGPVERKGAVVTIAGRGPIRIAAE